MKKASYRHGPTQAQADAEIVAMEKATIHDINDKSYGKSYDVSHLSGRVAPIEQMSNSFLKDLKLLAVLAA